MTRPAQIALLAAGGWIIGRVIKRWIERQDRKREAAKAAGMK